MIWLMLAVVDVDGDDLEIFVTISIMGG